jgi:hypothetical protein
VARITLPCLAVAWLSACGAESDGDGPMTAASITVASVDDAGETADDDGDSTRGADDGDDGGGSTSEDDGGDTTITSASSDEAGDPSTTDGGSQLDPPAGGSSGGGGGGPASGDVRMTADGITYRIIAPGGAGPQPLMIVYSGVEGGATMTNNLLMVGSFVGADVVFAVLDGVQYNGNGDAGASVIDQVRADYDIDNDRTWLLSESAGTTAGLELGLQLRQSYFAAYWANDVNATAVPSLDAATLGFQPFGNAGPGGAFAQADAIVAGMEAAGYRTPEPSPYDGPGAGTHGDPNQFVAALQWFPGKTRQ